MRTFACTLLLALCAMAAFAADATGKWTGTFTPEGGDVSDGVAILKQDGATLTGTAGPNDGEQMEILNGKVDGNKVTFEIKHPGGMLLKMDLVLDGDSLKGDVTFDNNGQTMKAKLDLKRVKA